MKEVPADFAAFHRKCIIKERLWSITHYCLGLGATILAILVTRQVDTGIFSAQTLSAVSAVFAVTLTFLSPSSRRKAFTEARDILRIARMKYEGNASDLHKAVEDAQKIISKF